MKRLLFLYTFIFFFVPCVGQIEDNFSDGNFSMNPIWEGDTSNFIINASNQLQLKAIESGQSQLYVQTNLEKEMEWNFFFNLDFNPSTSNSLHIYLQADNINLLESSGYFLEIGESGNEDAIKLYRQDSGIRVLLTTATSGAVASNPKVRLKIIREETGKWSMATDYAGGNNLQIESTIEDATYIETGNYFFGFNCKYTSTRTESFFFDDVVIQEVTDLIIDNIPPTVSNVKVIDENTLVVNFDEAIEEATGKEATNYFIDKNIGNPSTINLTAPNQVTLNFNTSFLNQEDYIISIKNIKDLSGNILVDYQTQFTFTTTETATPYDIIINEIMEDPTITGGATLGLPNQEYIELYNRSDKAINLENFSLTDGSKSAIFPAYSFLPNTYLIIATSNASELGSFGNFLGLTNFPILSSEEELILQDEFGTIIDLVPFTQDWYRSSSKAGGSVSLERINPMAPCEGNNNWTASSSLLGGTPGIENAVFDPTLESIPVTITGAYPIDSIHIKLTFSKAADETNALDIANYTLSNHEVTNVSLIGNTLKQVVLELATPLAMNVIEQIQLNTTFTDCLGNKLSTVESYKIALPVSAELNDLVINEILYNPQVGGVDFVEIYNTSQKVIDLSQLHIINLLANNPEGKQITVEKLIYPNQYIVFTPSPSDIQSRYIVESPTHLINQSLPTFSDKEDNVSIYIIDGNELIFIDQFDYSNDFQNSLLNDQNGVALERINPNLPTQSAGNWNSAASEAGFATPTYKNSQQLLTSNPNRTTAFSLSGNRISPDGDGFEDILQINYELEGEGYSGSIHLYDAAGRLIKKIIQNELLSTSGSFKWDGTTSDGQKTRVGIYVLWIEYFNEEGIVIQQKEAIVVAGNL